MKPLFWPVVLAVLLLNFTACKKKNNLSPIPAISFVGLSPDHIQAGSSEDTAYLSFTVADGDADLGNDMSSSNYDIYVKDSRDTTTVGYFFPEIPDMVRDPEVGMTGTATLVLLAAFILPRTDSLHMTTGDTLTYEIYIKDQAGNESNHITTSPLYLTP